MDQQALYVAVKRCASKNHPNIQLIRLKEVLAISGWSRSSIYAAIKKGNFPKAVKLQGKSSAWIRCEVEQWAVQCIRASRPDS